MATPTKKHTNQPKSGTMRTLKTPKFYRQRFILMLLEMVGGSLSKTDFQKLLFLSQKEADFSYYDFVPYHYGCYSFQAQSDVELLESLGWLKGGTKSISLIPSPGIRLKHNEAERLKEFTNRLSTMRGSKLVAYVYTQYPYYATRSKIADNILDNASYQNVCDERNKLINTEKAIYTIGYEGCSFENYINQLLKHDVKMLCDVRKNPLSRKFGFSKGILSRILPKLGIDYLHIPDLGIRSDMRQELSCDEDYARLFRSYRNNLPQKSDSLRLLIQMLDNYKRIALTCFEKEHHSCHRHCISDRLEDKNNIKIHHL